MLNKDILTWKRCQSAFIPYSKKTSGSIVIRDIRMWHRGTPNRSNYRRTNIALIYNRDWYGSGYSIQIPQEVYDQLPKRSRQLLRSEKIGYPVKMPWEW
ncbi:hypothetical protein [Paenibacillus sp. yr247]|uniref:hypothetical protein n=1 Tax=Paenibacillus sp. yr247 TaxID=1761880 RepID=UPI000B8897AF|nr:hypothetical protein [Paenibacillus sp. yr247]